MDQLVVVLGSSELVKPDLVVEVGALEFSAFLGGRKSALRKLIPRAHLGAPQKRNSAGKPPAETVSTLGLQVVRRAQHQDPVYG